MAAMELYDTWAKLPVTIPQWNTVNFGNFDGCLNFNRNISVNTPDSPESSILPIQGQYCLINLYIKLNLSSTKELPPNALSKVEVKQISPSGSVNIGFNSGFCIPSSCSPKQAIILLNNPVFLLPTMYEAIYADCQNLPEPTKLKSVDYAMIAIPSAALFLMIASTIYDASLLIRGSPNEPNELFTSFSLYRNGQRLFDTSPSKNAISSLHGLRALSILWIMFGHRVSNQLNFPLRTPTAAVEFYQHVYSVILSSYSIAVDTFFLMAAMLLTISTLRAFDKKRLNIPRMILHRYLRYTPVLGVAILCTITLPKFFISGPLQSSSNELRENCENFWWSALLHIQNYVNPDNLCLNHSWYLAVDFQLFVLSPFFILALKKNRWVMWMIPVLVTACSVYIFTISMVLEIYKFPRTEEIGELYHRLIYHPTHARIQSWLIGMALGFLFYNKDKLTFKINKFFDASLWIISLSLIISIILLSNLFANPINNFSTSLLSNALFMSLHRIFWSLALSYIIFACEHLESGSIIRNFLSSSIWKPIGTMGLSLYITHLIFMLFIIMNQQQPFDFSIWRMLHTYSGDLLPCFLIASFFYLAFEAPILIVENYFYKKLTKRET